jgi:oxygen-independent coproporphyrinogen-3 oxidase
MAAIAEGRFATARGVAVSADDWLRADIIGHLMCRYEADIGRACRDRQIDPDDFLASIEGLAPLVRDGLVAIDGWHITVTDRGRPLVRYVCAAFDRYLAGAEGRHSSGL